MTATAQYPDHLSAIERPIIDRIIREALHTRGYQIEVWGEDNDGEPDCPLTSDQHLEAFSFRNLPMLITQPFCCTLCTTNRWNADGAGSQKIVTERGAIRS